MIEKNIHQIWIGDKRIPKHIKEWMQEIKEKHPEFTYYFWTDDNLPKFTGNLKLVYNSLDHPAMKCDLMRYYVCFMYGGLYLDCDFKIKSPLSTDIFDSDYEAIMTYNDTDIIEDMSNSFIACNKYNKIFGFLLDNINEEKQWLGPNWYNQIVIKYFGKNWQDIDRSVLKDLFHKNKVYSIMWPDLNKNHFEHIALASWYPNSEWNNKFKTGDYE
jgi:mannosyltransferase OCH1-like enzyme